MNIIFLCKTKSHGSTGFRGRQITEEINNVYPGRSLTLAGKEIEEKIYDFNNSILIPILTVGDGLADYFNSIQIEQLKRRGNKIIPDILDSFCWDQYNPFKNNSLEILLNEMDGLIVYNEYTQNKIQEICPKLETYVIPHQWDNNFQKFNNLNRVWTKQLKAVYSGTRDGFQDDPTKYSGYVDFFWDTKEFRMQEFYDIHLSFRKQNTVEALFKPAAKLATAVGTKSLFLTSSDKSVRTLLGDSWPFYADTSDKFEQTLDAILRGQKDCIDALNYLNTIVRNFLSPSNISKMFIRLGS